MNPLWFFVGLAVADRIPLELREAVQSRTRSFIEGARANSRYFAEIAALPTYERSENAD